MKSGSFGAPKPLPGQPGYKVNETDVLEKDTREMEMRLQMLQERMRQQNLEADKLKQQTGSSSKWKGSKVEKGSIRQYGKEVTEKVKRRLVGENMLTGRPTLTQTTAAMESTSNSTVDVSGNFTTLDPALWSISDVSDWLSFLQLPAYVPVFATNEVDGRVLVDLSLEDLDYLNVTVLAHRKTLFKAIESIRASRVGSKGSEPPAPRPELLRSQSASKLPPAAVAVTKTHWSQVPPLSDNEVSGKGGVLVNAADYQEQLDREAEEAAFAEAVAEWRRQDAAAASTGTKKPLTIVREYETVKKSAATDEWVNPFAPPAAAVAKAEEAQLDEAFEHNEFVKAVEAWRKTNTTAAAANANAPSTHHPSASTSSGGVQASAANDSARAQADQLAKALDREQEGLQRQLEIQRRQAEQRLQVANAELQTLRARQQQEKAQEGFDDSMVSDEDECSASYASSHAVVHSTPDVVAAPPVSTVRVSLIESMLGGQMNDTSEADGPIVEYNSEDD